MRERVVAVIPARGGSKRIPRKNIRPFRGVPLLARTIARAAAKLAITRGIEDELREKDDGAADLFALVGSVTLAATSQTMQGALS